MNSFLFIQDFMTCAIGIEMLLSSLAVLYFTFNWNDICTVGITNVSFGCLKNKGQFKRITD